MKAVAAVTALALAFCAGHSTAATSSVTTTPLQVMTSQAGEEKEAFLLRVASELQTYTANTGFEACGLVGVSTSDQFAVSITTNKSHIGCLPTAKVEGFVFSSESIHSHPQVTHYRVNQVDVVFLSAQGASVHVNMMDEIHPETFSKPDFAAGRGYLVTEGKLLYQYGAANPIRVVGEVK